MGVGYFPGNCGEMVHPRLESVSLGVIKVCKAGAAYLDDRSRLTASLALAAVQNAPGGILEAQRGNKGRRECSAGGVFI